MANIFESIAAIMSEITPVAKDQKNLQQNFMYRGVDGVMNALSPLLAKHKVFIVPEIMNSTREDRVSNKGNNLIYSILTIRYTFYAEDGSSIQAIVVGEGMDSGDKATNKAMAIGYKYACFQVFCIPTEEMPDPDAESHEVLPYSKKTTPAKSAPAPAPAPAEPVGPELISEKQLKRLYVIGLSGYKEHKKYPAEYKLTKDETETLRNINKNVIASYGYEHANEIHRKHYEAICNDITEKVSLL